MFKIFIRNTVSLFACALFIILVIGYASGALGAANVFCLQTIKCNQSGCQLTYPFLRIYQSSGTAPTYTLVEVSGYPGSGYGISCKYKGSDNGYYRLYTYDITNLLTADASVPGNKWIQANGVNYCSNGGNEIHSYLCPMKSIMNNGKS